MLGLVRHFVAASQPLRAFAAGQRWLKRYNHYEIKGTPA